MITLDFRAERAQEKVEGEEPTKAKAEEIPKPKASTRLIDVAPGRYHVSTIVSSKFSKGRVYLALDGHRSDDMNPYLFVSEDFGQSWKKLHKNIPASAGSVRVMVEDIENQNLLFMGTEFGAWVSIDRGKNWTRFNNNLPTVPVHDFKVHPLSGELIAGTHGRSAWAVDIFALRQMATDAPNVDVALYEPNHVIRWKREPERAPSGTRRFVGENPDANAHIYFSLADRERQIKLWITDQDGETVKTLTPDGGKGLHHISWNMKLDGESGRRWSRRVDLGIYKVHLKVGDTTWTESLEIIRDPSMPDPRWDR
jgi:hypothetical protein